MKELHMSPYDPNSLVDGPYANDNVLNIARQLSVLAKVVAEAVLLAGVSEYFPRLIRLEEKRWETDKDNKDDQENAMYAKYRREAEIAIHLLGPKDALHRLAAEIRLQVLCTEQGSRVINEKIPGIEIIHFNAKSVASDRFDTMLTVIALLDTQQKVVKTIQDASSWVSGAKDPRIPNDEQPEVKQHNSSAKPELPFNPPIIPTPLEPWDVNSSLLKQPKKTPHQEQTS